MWYSAEEPEFKGQLSEVDDPPVLERKATSQSSAVAPALTAAKKPGRLLLVAHRLPVSLTISKTNEISVCVLTGGVVSALKGDLDASPSALADAMFQAL